MRLIDAELMAKEESQAYMSAQILIDDEPLKSVNEVVHRKIQMLIADTPTADAVPIVRCKDCKYRYHKFCHKLNNDIQAEDYERFFCRDGKEGVWEC